MQLERIVLENIRGLGVGEPLDLKLRAADGELPRWVVVVGPNGAGKSTLLRAIALGCAGPTTSLALQPSMSWWLSAVDGDGGVYVELVTSAAGPQTSGEFRHAKEDIEVGARTLTVEGSFTPGAWEDPWSHRDQRPDRFIAGYGPYRRLARGSRTGEDLAETPARPVAQLASLFREDVALVEPLDWLKQLELEDLQGDDDAAHLKPRLLGLLSDGLLQSPSGAVAKVEKITSRGLIIRDGDLSLPLTDLSDGYQTVVGLVLDLIRQFHRAASTLDIEHDASSGRYVVRNEGIVLIDEIESHLHPSWQRTIGRWLVERFPNVQFIVATHSPFICQEAADHGAIIRLARPGEDAQSRVLDTDELAPLLDGTADDIYLSGLFGVDSTRSARGERLLDRLAELEARILGDESTPEEEAEYRRLKALAPPSSDVIQALRALGLRL